MKIRKLRLLRMKHNIHLDELGEAAGLTKQRISQIELGEEQVTPRLAAKIDGAVYEVMVNRLLALNGFESDYLNHQKSLFDLVENDYEL